jgi:putative hydrolase of the HAD superfamily
MNPVRAVIFDVGGTLIHPAEPVGETYARLARRHGAKLDPEATTTAFRRAFRQHSGRAPGAVPRDGNDRAWWKTVVRGSIPEGALSDPAGFEACFEELYLYFGEPAAWTLYPDVLPALHDLDAKRLPLALLTNFDARVHAVLDGLGVGDYFPRARRFVSAELGLEKPDPAIYAHVQRGLDLPAGALLSVGDDVPNDIDAPAAAGWQTHRVDRPQHDLASILHFLR